MAAAGGSSHRGNGRRSEDVHQPMAPAAPRSARCNARCGRWRGVSRLAVALPGSGQARARNLCTEAVPGFRSAVTPRETHTEVSTCRGARAVRPDGIGGLRKRLRLVPREQAEVLGVTPHGVSDRQHRHTRRRSAGGGDVDSSGWSECWVPGVDAAFWPRAQMAQAPVEACRPERVPRSAGGPSVSVNAGPAGTDRGRTRAGGR